MNPMTGELHHGTDAEIRKMEDKLSLKMVRVPLRDAVKVAAMTDSQRKSYAKNLRKRRSRSAQARKARRKNRQ